MKLTDKEGLEIASTVKDVLEGKVKKETYGKKKKVDEVEEPRPEGEKKFKKKHVVKKSGEKEDGTVMKEEKPEVADKAESRHKADDDTVAMIKANPKMKDKVLKSLNPKARKAVLKALGEQINEFKTSFPFFDLKTATAAEKLAMKMKIHSKSEKKGKLYTVHVDGKFTDIEKWVDAL